jgi:hypothetical protein
MWRVLRRGGQTMALQACRCGHPTSPAATCREVATLTNTAAAAFTSWQPEAACPCRAMLRWRLATGRRHGTPVARRAAASLTTMADPARTIAGSGGAVKALPRDDRPPVEGAPSDSDDCSSSSVVDGDEAAPPRGRAERRARWFAQNRSRPKNYDPDGPIGKRLQYLLRDARSARSNDTKKYMVSLLSRALRLDPVPYVKDTGCLSCRAVADGPAQQCRPCCLYLRVEFWLTKAERKSNLRHCWQCKE